MYIDWGKLERAVPDLTLASKIKPTRYVFNDLGQFYRKQKKEYQTALEWYEKARKMDPHWWAPYCNKGLCFEKEGEYNLALANFTKSISLVDKNTERDFPQPFLFRARVFQQVGKLDEALQDFIHVLELDPMQHSAYFGIGCIYETAHEWEKAIDSFTLAIDIAVGSEAKIDNTEFAKYYTERALAYSSDSVHQYESALNDITMAQKLDTQAAKNLRIMGDIYSRMEYYSQALQSYSSSLILNPENYLSLYGHGVISFKLGNYDTAINDIERAVELHKDIDKDQLLDNAKKMKVKQCEEVGKLSFLITFSI